MYFRNILTIDTAVYFEEHLLWQNTFVFLALGILELYTRKVCEVFVYEHTETIEYVKN